MSSRALLPVRLFRGGHSCLVRQQHLRPTETTSAAKRIMYSTEERKEEDDSLKSRTKRRSWIPRWLQVSPRVDNALYRTGVIEDPDLRAVISKTVGGVWWGGVALAALGTAGVDTSPILASLSVTGITAGFAAKDIGSNYMAGLLIIVTKPFARGDYVAFGKLGDNLQGIVMEIATKHTIIRPLGSDSHDVMIPNSTVINSVLHVLPLPEAPSSDSSNSSSDRSTKKRDTDTNHPAQLRTVARIAARELTALDEFKLRQEYNDVLAAVTSNEKRRILAWLLDNKSNTENEHWCAYTESGEDLSWIPTPLRALVLPPSSGI